MPRIVARSSNVPDRPSALRSRSDVRPAIPVSCFRRSVDADASSVRLRTPIRNECEHVLLEAHLLGDPDERRMREVAETHVREQRSRVIVASTAAGNDRTQLDRPRHGSSQRLGVRLDGRRNMRRVDRHRPRAVGVPILGTSGWAVDRSHLCVRIRRERGGVEGRVFDVVAHRGHVLVSERFDVHERAAVIEPELTVIAVVDAEPEVHELRWRPDVELQALEDRHDIIALVLQRPLHAPGVPR